MVFNVKQQDEILVLKYDSAQRSSAPPHTPQAEHIFQFHYAYTTTLLPYAIVTMYVGVTHGLLSYSNGVTPLAGNRFCPSDRTVHRE